MPEGAVLEVFGTDERVETTPSVDVMRWQALARDSLQGCVAAGWLPARLATESGELNLLFVDVDEMADLNRHHMHGDGPTDVLSFPLDDIDEPIADGQVRLWGDIVICPAVVEANAADHTGSVDDEFALMVVHGVLHIVGMDHQEPDDAAEMHAAERALLSTLYGPVQVPEHATTSPS